MQHYDDSEIKGCLYFSMGALWRKVNALAEHAFAPTGLCPSRALMLILIARRPGIVHTELAGRLFLSQSTVSRFADSLAGDGMISRVKEGRLVHLHTTEKGAALVEGLNACWDRLYADLKKAVGEKTYDPLLALVLAGIAQEI